MSILVAVPIFRVSCRVGIDKGRPWSIVDELILASIARVPRTIKELADHADLPRQLVVASIARLMRFRLIEVRASANGASFMASPYGFEAVSSGNPLPFFPKRLVRKASFVIERATGTFFPTRDVLIKSPRKIEAERKVGADVRILRVEGDGPTMSQEANLNRLSEVVAQGWDEQLASIDGRTASVRDDEYMVVRVVDGVPRGLPEAAGDELRQIVDAVAALDVGNPGLTVQYSGQQSSRQTEPVYHDCSFSPDDLIIGGSAQRVEFEKLVRGAHQRVIIHSTFIKALDVEALFEIIRAACRRGVRFSVFWGAEYDEETETRNAAEAAKIMEMVSKDADIAGRFVVDMRTTGSHAKVMLVDTPSGEWLAAVSSCNWLKSPFRNVELTAILRDQTVVADVMGALQQIIGRRGLSDTVATELHLTKRDLKRLTPKGGPTRIALISGDAHDALLREASGTATKRLVLGCHKLGSTARPGALLQGQVAASRPGMAVSVLYTMVSKPMRNRHARELKAEAAANGFRLVEAGKIPLHGKFLAWDNDDLVVTSMNWASASSEVDFPDAEIGVHITSEGIATAALDQLTRIFPELEQQSSNLSLEHVDDSVAT